MLETVHRRRWLQQIWALPSALVLILCVAADAASQEGQGIRATNGTFDLDRALVHDSTVFEPFVVTETRLLSEALADGVVNEGSPLMIMEHEAGTLGFLMEQLAYHHVAQGEMAGEPWMVTF